MGPFNHQLSHCCFEGVLNVRTPLFRVHLTLLLLWLYLFCEYIKYSQLVSKIVLLLLLVTIMLLFRLPA